MLWIKLLAFNLQSYTSVFHKDRHARVIHHRGTWCTFPITQNIKCICEELVLIKLVFLMLQQGHFKVKLLVLIIVYSSEKIGLSISTTMLIPTKEPDVLAPIAYAPSVQMSTQRKMQLTSLHYHENSFDLMNLLKEHQRTHIFCRSQFEKSLQSKRAATIKLQTFVALK